MPLTSKHLRKKYCLGIYKSCARYLLAGNIGIGRVPLDAFPNDVELWDMGIRAAAIIGSLK